MAEELKKQYQEILNRLENLQLDSSDRDAKYLQIASLLNDDFNTERKMYLREGKLNELKNYRNNIKDVLVDKANLLQKREKEIEIAKTFYTGIDETFRKQSANLKHELGSFKDYQQLSQQKYKVKKYDQFINKETIHLLYVLFIIFIICLLCLLLGLFQYLEPAYVVLLIITFVILYVLYLVKMVYIDRVNINKYIFKKYDFNKPSENELDKGKKEETEFKKFEKQDECNKKESTYGPVSTEIGGRNDELIGKVTTDIGDDADAQSKCIAGPYDPV